MKNAKWLYLESVSPKYPVFTIPNWRTRSLEEKIFHEPAMCVSSLDQCAIKMPREDPRVELDADCTSSRIGIRQIVFAGLVRMPLVVLRPGL